MLSASRCAMEQTPGSLVERTPSLGSSLTRSLSPGEWAAPSCVEDPWCPLTRWSLPGTAVMVSKLNLHEDYDSWTVYNDICTLGLAEEADLSSDVIDVIALPEENEEYEAGTECIVSGWGTTSSGG